MKKTVIWDLDGTLFDSYDVIVESIYLALKEHKIMMDLEQIHQYAIAFSIKSLFAKVSKEHSVSEASLYTSYSRISSGKYLEIKPMNGAIETLKVLKQNGIENYVFTHRGKTTVPVLENLKMNHFFKEVVTSQNGFSRKPDPEGLTYLMKKYELSPNHTWYVGDRSLDMDCAKNAGIPGILYLPLGNIDVSGGSEQYLIKDLLELLQIL